MWDEFQVCLSSFLGKNVTEATTNQERGAVNVSSRFLLARHAVFE
tara:strand:- start:81 stop:215 length:135 start_codon:yes stop_codon:yes gene_type:complete